MARHCSGARHAHIMTMNRGADTPMRVASYNIRKCVGLDWRRSPERTLDVVGGLEAEIVALQEADKRLGARPAALPADAVTPRTGLVPLMLRPDGDSLGFHGNALLLHRDIDVETVALLDLPGLEPRGAVIADIVRHGIRMRVVATHLGLMRRHRLQQLSTIRDALSTLEDRPTLILGDFNEWTATGGLGPLRAGFTVHAPGRSFHAARPVAGLDRISHCRRLNLRDAGVAETALSRRASDHLPIWAELALSA